MANNVEKIQKVRQLTKRLEGLNQEIISVDPWVEIVLGDKKTYKLEYSYGATKRVMRKTGLNLNVIDLSARDVMNDEIFPTLLFEGLTTHHKDAFPDEDALLDVVQRRHMSYYMACMQKALESAQPDQEKMREILQELQDVSTQQEEEQETPLAEMPSSSSSGQNVKIMESPI